MPRAAAAARSIWWFIYSGVAEGHFDQVELAMLMVGHTHEDIDQAFAVIAAKLRAEKFVANLDQYRSVIRNAWGESTDGASAPTVEDVHAVLNVDGWMKGHVDHLEAARSAEERFDAR